MIAKKVEKESTIFKLTADEMVRQLTEMVERKDASPNYAKAFILLTVETTPVIDENGNKIYPELDDPEGGFSVNMAVVGKNLLLSHGLAAFLLNDAYNAIVSNANIIAESEYTKNSSADKHNMDDFADFIKRLLK